MALQAAIDRHWVETAADGTPLKIKLHRTERFNRLRAYSLILPLLAFIFITFMMPILVMLWRSIDNLLLARNLPKTLAVLAKWDPATSELPPEAAFATIAEELSAAQQNKAIGRFATRLNYEQSGTRSLLTKTGQELAKLDEPAIDNSWQATLIDIDNDWADPDVWTAIKNYGSRYTIGNDLAALDLHFASDGSIAAQPTSRQIYIQVMWRTIWISLLVTAVCLLLGYPVAYLLATLPTGVSNLLMILVLLPFWTSLLVRTTAWVVVLQTAGVLNDLMIWLNLIDRRMQLIFNRSGVVVTMTHILLPFMILPIYSVMKTISPAYVRAAQSLGANPWTAIWRVYSRRPCPASSPASSWCSSLRSAITPRRLWSAAQATR